MVSIGECNVCDKVRPMWGAINLKKFKMSKPFEPIRLSTNKIGVLQGYDFTEESKLLIIVHETMKEFMISIDLKAMEFCIKHFYTCSTSFPNEFGIRVENHIETIQCNVCNTDEILLKNIEVIVDDNIATIRG